MRQSVQFASGNPHADWKNPTRGKELFLVQDSLAL